MLKIIKRSRLLLSVAVLSGSAVAFFTSNQYAALKLAFNYWDPLAVTEYRLKRLSTEEFISEIQSSIDEGNLSDAEETVNLALEYGHPIPQRLIEQSKEGMFQTGLRWSTAFGNGFVFGNMDSVQAITGTILSDFVLVGDIRDLSTEGGKLLLGEDYDTVTLGLAAFGATTSTAALLAWAGIVGTAGASSPAATAATGLDNSVSIIKTAHKFGKISKKLTENVFRITKDAVNVNKLKTSISALPSAIKSPSSAQIMSAVRKVNFKDVVNGKTDDITKVLVEITPVDLKKVSNLTDGLLSQKATNELTELASINYKILATAGPRISFKALEIADNAKDMNKIGTIATKFGKKSSSILKVLGKKAYKLGKLSYWLATLLIGVLGWVLWTAWLLLSITRGTMRLLVKSAGKA
ncbi:hypothetical protein [Ochrobactrum soli]|uniref:Transcriptional regulator n=1 Tax=Ochrobactrum soli TaxID=2448455 RepID=A0A2P9HNS5_9HYPH|nr:hypothetical protein [[Ochrobactrum] soli]SPL65754.1 putative exported protein of unknown function [[Ochrobactrum] soli]